MKHAAWMAICLLGMPAFAGPHTAQLVATLQTSDHVKLRANAARLLAKDGSPEALDALIGAASDPSAVVRATVCFSLVAYIDRRVKPALQKAQQDPDASVRKAASTSLRQISAARPLTAAATGKQPGLSLNEVRSAGKDPVSGLLREAIEAYIQAAATPIFLIAPAVDRGYSLGGALNCEDRKHGATATIACKVNLVVSRQPGNVVLGSVGAQAEAGVANPQQPASRQATERALLKALAKSLVEDMVSVVNQDREQNGEEELK
jgi:hypothetical protein